jgi:hypothetical protein
MMWTLYGTAWTPDDGVTAPPPPGSAPYQSLYRKSMEKRGPIRRLAAAPGAASALSRRQLATRELGHYPRQPGQFQHSCR